jgi:hypothetical protein
LIDLLFALDEVNVYKTYTGLGLFSRCVFFLKFFCFSCAYRFLLYRSAASRRGAPASMASITLARKSLEYGLGGLV